MADANAYDLTQLGTEDGIPMLYDRQRIEALYDVEVVRPAATDKSGRLSGEGNKFNVYTRERFSTPSTPLADGATIDITGVTHTPTEITINYYGDAKQMNEQALDSGFEFFFSDFSTDAVEALGELRNAIGMTELTSNASETVYPKTDAGVYYDNITVDGNAIMTYEQVLDIATKLKRNRHTRGAYGFVAPEQMAQLLLDSRVVSIDYMNTKNAINGTVGRLHGVDFIETNAIPTATENTSYEVASAVFLSKKPDTFIFAEKKAPVIRVGRDSVRDLFINWSYHTAFGFKVVDSNGVIVGKSVIGTV